MKRSLLCVLSIFIALVIVVTTAFFALGKEKDGLNSSILADTPASVNSAKKPLTIILDPGHGGIDGGAVGMDGTLEKDLNLELAARTAELLRSMGYTVLLTREEDVLLGEGSKGHLKAADLQYRLKLANAQENALLVSIHMNKFPLESCNGIQIYYSKNHKDGVLLAEEIRSLVKDFQKENQREIKKADSSIYLLDRATLPAVLIECGFLSNSTECALLKDPIYQKKLSILIASAICTYEEQTAQKD